MSNKRIIQVEEKVPFQLLLPLSIQHMFAMFGASVLVPFIFGISPAIVLFMNGLGTLLFILVTKGKAPAYLGSSFAFLAPAGIVIANFGYEYALGGFVAVGFCGCVLALIVYKFGTDWIDVVLPPAAMGPVVADWSGAFGNCSQQCRTFGGNHSSGKSDGIPGNSGCGCVRFYFIPRLFIRNSHSDCGTGRIRGSSGMWNCKL